MPIPRYYRLSVSTGTNCPHDSVCPWQPRPQEGYFDIQRAESRMGLADTHL
jgi:hypothetical protein